MPLRRLIAVPVLLLALPTAAAAQGTPPPATSPAPPAATQPAPAPAPAPPPEPVIADGVRAGGVDVGGQTVAGAATTLQLAFDPGFARPVDVAVGDRIFRLNPQRAGFRFDALRTARRAYYAGVLRGPGQRVKLALTFSTRYLRRWAVNVDRRTARAPRNASVRITPTTIFVKRPRTGRTIDEVSLARRLAATLRDPRRTRVLRQRLRPDRPDVGMRELRARYATVVTVDRRTLHLRLFKRLRHVRTYRIAIGMAGYGTPGGLFSIQSKQVNPAWHVPNSAWAGSLAGTTVPGGAPNNPLRARWLGVNGAVGIHGTSEEWSIGTRASHGCIRMRVSDVVELYRRVPLGTPVLIR